MNKVKQGSNMYDWITHTWNPIRGTCPHHCSYCYVPKALQGTPWGELRLDEKALNENLGSGNFIFVGSSTDMWADAVPQEWQVKVIHSCCNYDNTYLFQTKNPARFAHFWFPPTIILAITLESNRQFNGSKAVCPTERANHFKNNSYPRKMVSIEPVMDFDLLTFAEMIEAIQPEFVSIGADSGHNHLPEPTPEKLRDLIEVLGGFTKVYQKTNLERLLL